MQLRRVLRLVMDERGWWRLPRYLLGTSAGGSAAMILAARFPVQVSEVCASPRIHFLFEPSCARL